MTELTPGDERPRAGPDEEAGIARVLRAAGSRSKPSDEMKASVRAAVHAEWRAAVARRAQRRRLISIAAAVVTASLVLWMGRAYFAQPREIVANVSRTVGGVESRAGVLRGWQLAAPRSQLYVGEELRTGPSGRAALELRDGVSLRLDYDSRVVFAEADRVNVLEGALYIDAGVKSSEAERLRVGTPMGIVQHVGTQYEVRLVGGSETRIRVREGRISVVPERGEPQTAQVGEQLLVSSSGHIERDAIAPSDAQWQWAATLAPAFSIDGKPVREFLTWVGRELGRDVVFATPQSEAEADRAVLSGSVEGLAPAEALAAVLPTTSLRSELRDRQIEISLQPNP